MKPTIDMKFTYTGQHTFKGVLSGQAQKLIEEIHGFATRKGGAYKEQIEVLRTPFDGAILSDARAMAERMNTSSLEVIFVVGIGGSSLGTRAIIEALQASGEFIEVIFLESLSTRRLHAVRERVAQLRSADQFVVNVISKAGATTETIANFSILSGFLSHIKDWGTRVVVTTTPESELAKLAAKEKYAVLHMPPVISGRYSVFTAVGVFPLTLAGYPVQDILEGARGAQALLLTPHDPTRRLIEDIIGSLQHGGHIIDFFFFNGELEALGKWGRQLYAESLGKVHDRSGREVHTGITPTVSIGSEDLHSMVQLYYGGPRDRITVLIPPLSAEKHVVPKHPFTALVPGIEGKSTDEINKAICTGVAAAFRSYKIPAGEATFPALNAPMIGAFMQWQMQVVAVLAEHLNICAFDQPNVEDYKKVTHSLLLPN
jgi:glucose-6-phosphate isomerase